MVNDRAEAFALSRSGGIKRRQLVYLVSRFEEGVPHPDNAVATRVLKILGQDLAEAAGGLVAGEGIDGDLIGFGGGNAAAGVGGRNLILLPIFINIVSRIMKTTIELSDDLARKAKDFAARKGTTLRAVIEQGIRIVLREDVSAETFRLRDASVGGRGLQEEFRDADWKSIREAAYEERGG